MTMEGTTRDSHSTRRTVVDLNEMLRSIVKPSECRRSAGNAGFTMDLAKDLPNIYVDSQGIKRVLATLITNAEDAIGENLGRPGQVHVKTAVQGKRIQVAVTDNGRGIHWREMDRLFGDQSRDVELTLCAEMVKDNGGDLYAWSRYGNGSVFTLELPIRIGIEQQEGRLDDTPEQKGLQGKRILVIDDEVHISTLMVDMLEQQGAEIDLANSGVQAVEQIKSNHYDLFICDQRMPDLSGERLYRSIESMNPALRYRFLFVTGDAANDETQDFLAQTGVQYIRKPFRTIELVAAAEEVLSRNQQLDF